VSRQCASSLPTTRNQPSRNEEARAHNSIQQEQNTAAESTETKVRQHRGGEPGQHVRGMRISVIPLVRMLSSVVMS